MGNGMSYDWSPLVMFRSAGALHVDDMGKLLSVICILLKLLSYDCLDSSIFLLHGRKHGIDLAGSHYTLCRSVIDYGLIDAPTRLLLNYSCVLQSFAVLVV